jgi:hypothetical protein
MMTGYVIKGCFLIARKTGFLLPMLPISVCVDSFKSLFGLFLEAVGIPKKKFLQ